MRGVGTGAASLATALLLVATARAESSVQPFRVESRVPPTCAAAQTFGWQLVVRTRLLRPARGEEPALLFTVEVSDASDGVHGRLTIREPDGRATERELKGEDCPEVISALALVAAILIDPYASTVPLPPNSPGVSSAPVAPPPSIPLPAPSADFPTAPNRSWSVGLGAGASLQTTVAPDPILGFVLKSAILPPRTEDFDPALYLSLHFAQSPTLNKLGGNAQLVWAFAKIAACPLRWPSRTRAGLRPCLSFSGGALRGRGSNTSEAATKTVPWLAAGGLVAWELMIGKHALLGAQGGVDVPLFSARFYFGPDETAFRVRPIGLAADVHLGVRFP
jgi:hypothetical protein